MRAGYSYGMELLPSVLGLMSRHGAPLEPRKLAWHSSDGPATVQFFPCTFVIVPTPTCYEFVTRELE
jgi:hypothetical protein